jgi:hypothetical protein
MYLSTGPAGNHPGAAAGCAVTSGPRASEPDDLYPHKSDARNRQDGRFPSRADRRSSPVPSRNPRSPNERRRTNRHPGRRFILIRTTDGLSDRGQRDEKTNHESHEFTRMGPTRPQTRCSRTNDTILTRSRPGVRSSACTGLPAYIRANSCDSWLLFSSVRPGGISRFSDPCGLD